MGWIKKPRRSPKALGFTHLDDVLTPDDYQQPAKSVSQKALGYPWEGIAGRLEVREWSPGNLICTFTAWTGGVATRTYYSGSWREWRDATGKEIT